MRDITYVATKQELNIAVNNKAEHIVITNPKVARNVRVAMGASKASISLGIAIVTGSLALTAFPIVGIPLGLGVSVPAFLSGNSLLLIAISVLGVAIIKAIRNDYDVDNKFKLNFLGIRVESHLVLTRKKGK